MAYIGRSVDIGMFEKQVLTPDSSTTTFTLTYAVGSANSLLVVYGGVIQEPAVAYSVSGGGQSIVFSEAPLSNHSLYVIYLGKQLTTPRAAGQETTKQTFTGDGTTTLFTLTDPPVVPAGIMVFVDGILQREGSGNNFVSSGSTINFNGAPDSGAEIDVYTLVKEKVSIDTVADGSITRAKMAASFPYWDASGNVGINVASPTRKLQISGTGASGVSTANPAVRLDNAATGRFALWELSADANMYLWNGDTGSGSTVFLRGSGSGTETARFDQNGNFLMNTAASGTSRIQALQAGVNATSLTTTTVKNLGVKLGFSGTTNSDGYIFGGIAMGGDGEEYAGIAAYDNGSSAATGLMFFTGNTSGVGERMRMDTLGVRINSTAALQSSSEALTVGNNSFTSVAGAFRNSSTSAATLYISNVDSTANTIQPNVYFTDGSGNRGGIGHKTTDASAHYYAQGGFTFYTGAAGFANARISIPSNAAGITFPATQVASSDPNTLDDYEEGTWTPTIIGNTSGTTSGGSRGSYTKIGNRVILNFTFINPAAATLVGGWNISGLPFPTWGPQGDEYHGGTASYYRAVPTVTNGTQVTFLRAGSGSTTLSVNWNLSTTGETTSVTGNVPSANLLLSATIVYQTNT